MTKIIKKWSFILWGVMLPCLSFAQITMEIYDDSSYVSPLRVMLRNSPQPVTAEMKKTLVDFASKERWRFVRDVYPQFQRLDSLFPNEEDRAKIAQNPYAILNPTLIDYRYQADFEVENLYLYASQLYLRNIFKVRRKEPLFIKNLETTENAALPDTLFGWTSNLNLFAPDADLFIVYYCPPRNDIRMVGGYAYLQPFPEESFKPREFEYLYQNSGAITEMRLGQAISFERYVNDSFHHGEIPDSLHKLRNEGGTYYHLVRKKLYTGPAYPRPEYYLALAGPTPYISDIWVTETHTGREPYKLKHPEFEPWTRIEIFHFATNPVEAHPKGFPGYEVRYVVKRSQESYQDLLPIVRGIPQAEWDRIINDPFWKKLVGKY